MRKLIMDSDAIRRALTRIAYEIIERNRGARNLVIAGIKTRGVYLARRIAKRLRWIGRVQIPVTALDVTKYRDDIEHDSSHHDPTVVADSKAISVQDKDVILVDDVLYTGRTVKAALSALSELGRPRTVQLAILVDRGHRELPIRADFVGKNIPSSQKERIQVSVKEIDHRDAVEIIR